ncbi:MAG: ABC transporter substrate-binding protein [Ahrensia sp.]
MKKTLMAAMMASAAMMSAQSAQAMDEITVAYFLEWPMPFQFAKVNGTYEEALGAKINWVSFDTGTAMSAAMASGDVQISVSQGVPPFVVASSAGQDIQIVDVAVSYSENDNCVVASGLEINKDSAAELAGKKVAVPLGTAAHYGFLSQMNHFGVDIAGMEIVDMAPAEGAAALAQGSLDMACGWGGALRRMKEHGNVLLTGAEKEELGILVFDVTSAPASFVAEESEMLAKFLKVTADANAMWADEANHAKMLPVIAKDAGMSEEDTASTLATFVFPTVDEQMSAKWLGGGAQSFMQGVAGVFVDAGSIPAALDSYDATVNTGPLAAAKGM